jgi:hypothetical protein
MPDDLGFILAIVFSEIVPAIIFLYAAYWAFEIRRALADHLRRNLALWQGAASVIIAPSVFLTYTNNFYISVLLVVYYGIAFAVLFAFFDAAVKVARRSDPLLRSILNWEKTRYVGWVGVVLISIFNVLALIPSLSNVAGFLVEVCIAITFIVGGAGILVGAKRIRDPFLKDNLKWLGLTLVLAICQDIASALETFAGLSNYDIYYSYPALIAAVFAISAGYCIYRAARSLAPINHMSLETGIKVEPPT